MIINLYTIFDNVAKETGPLFEAKNSEVAIRKTVKLVLENGLNHFDYSLIDVGRLNTETAEIKSVNETVYYADVLKNEMNRLMNDLSTKKDKTRDMFLAAYPKKKEVVNE